MYIVCFQTMVYSNMVLLTVVTTSNPHTLYFDHPIEKPSYIRLLSASLYNSWYNLAENGTMSVRRAQGGQSSGAGSPTYVSITAGHYTPESMAKAITEAFKKENIDIAVETRTSLGVMNILNPKNTYLFTLSNNLKTLFGVSLQVNSNILVRRFNSKNSYFIHSDLVDKRQNLLNGKPSTLFAKLNVKGQPYTKITYQAIQPHVLRDTDSGDYDVNSITISVQDEKGNLFDFNGMPLEFELEIN